MQDSLRGRSEFAPCPASDRSEARQLKEQAERCRRLSRATHDKEAAELLKAMAEDLEEKAWRLQSRPEH